MGYINRWVEGRKKIPLTNAFNLLRQDIPGPNHDPRNHETSQIRCIKDTDSDG